MPDIVTLPNDIRELLTGIRPCKHGGAPTHLPNIEAAFVRQLTPRETEREVWPLWASEYGDSCARKLWYKRHESDKGKPLPPSAKFKFMYGDVIEELLLVLAAEAGHTVTHTQERAYLKAGGWGQSVVTGKMDAIIDGHVVDVKSMSSFSFQKYVAEGLTSSNDSFGYRWQLAFYHWFAVQEGIVDPDSTPYILGADKQLGHIALIPCQPLPTDVDVIKRAAVMAEMVKAKEEPARAFTPVPEGKSGNMKLDVNCAYCDFHHICWPGLRKFLSSKGPLFLTEVKREPRMTEVPV